MSMTPTMRNTGTDLQMQVPYLLNSSFRELFKTARWDASRKVFVARATTQNLNKWTKFMETVESAVQTLAQADEMEVTARELERAAQEAVGAVHKAQADIADCEQRALEARAQKARAVEQIAELKPLLEQAQAALAAVKADAAQALSARNDSIAPALELYKSHGLTRIPDEFERAGRRGYLGKDALGRAQSDIEEVRDDLKEIGYRNQAIDDLANVSLNRPDKVISFVESARATSRSGLEASA